MRTYIQDLTSKTKAFELKNDRPSSKVQLIHNSSTGLSTALILSYAEWQELVGFIKAIEKLTKP